MLITLHCPLHRKSKADHFQDDPKYINKVKSAKAAQIGYTIKQTFLYCYVDNSIFKLVERDFIFYVNFETCEEQPSEVFD